MSLEVLARLSRRCQGPNPPSRRDLIEEFCRAVGWHDAQGRLSISSASVALRRLEKENKVQLPPMTPRSKTARPRGLSDDGQPLPVLPRLMARGQDMTGLKLRLIQDEHDPAHPIWNRLIAREHPLGRSPLVGRQLRYVVECDQGMLGAGGEPPGGKSIWPACWRPINCKRPAAWPPSGSCCWPKTPPA